jgi:hypothetical protein
LAIVWHGERHGISENFHQLDAEYKRRAKDSAAPNVRGLYLAAAIQYLKMAGEEEAAKPTGCPDGRLAAFAAGRKT